MSSVLAPAMISGIATLSHRAIQQQMVILEDHADLPTQERHLAVFQTADVVAAKPDVPGAGPFDTANQFQQGTFPAPEWPVRNAISAGRRWKSTPAALAVRPDKLY